MADVNLQELLNKKKQETEQTVEVVEPAMEVQNVQAAVETITPEQRAEIDSIKEKLDLTDSGAVIQFGGAAQKNIADFSDSVLSTVRTKDSGQVGELLGQLVTGVKEYEEEDKSFWKKLPIVGALAGKAENIKQRYDKLSVQVERISGELDKARMDMMKDIIMFDGLYDKNLEYFRSLELYIKAGEEKLAETRDTVLPKLRQEAAASADSMAAQVVSDFESTVDRFEKRVHDLKLSKTIAIQTAPQIRLIQNNDKMLVDKVQSAIYNTIPLWKNQMVIALGLQRQKKVIELQRAVSDATNELLKKNAEMLKQNTVDAAKENERGIVDIETVKKVNDDLVSTIEETIKIQQDGRQKRANAEKELLAIEQRLKETLLKNMEKPVK